MKKFFSILPLLLLAATLRAQSTAPLSQDDLSKILASSLDNQTLAIAHLDASRINLPALQSFITELFDAGKVPTGDENRKQLAQAQLVADAYLSKFQSLGGRHAFFVLSHADLWPFTEPPVAILLPLENNADPKPLIDFLQSIPTSAGNPMTVELLPSNVIFYGTASCLDHLKSLTPTPRPDLLLPLTTTPAAAFQIVYVQTPDIRRAVAEIMPRFPADSPILPGATTDFITQGLKYVSLSVTLPPNPSLSLTLSTTSPENCAQLTAGLKSLLDLVVADPDYQNEIAHPREEDKVPLAASQLFLKDLYDFLNTPNSTADLTATFDEPKMRDFFQFASPLFAQAQANAARQKSMAKLKQLTFGCIMYGNDNKNAYPTSLDQLTVGGYLPKDFNFINPADPQHRPYVYHPWTPDQLKKLNSSTTPLIWETSDDDRTRISVSFLDGHVESLNSRTDLAELLKKAEQHLNDK